MPSADGAEIAVHYERLPVRPRYRIGEALPFLPTGERFGAMRITDRLAAEGTPVVLPFAGRSETVARFRADGTLTAEDGGNAASGDLALVAGRARGGAGGLRG